MTTEPEDPRLIYVETVALHPDQWRTTELRDMAQSMIKSRLYGKVMAEGYVPTESVTVLPPRSVRRVREEHHEHGWQTVEVEATEDTADLVYLTVEVAAALPGSNASSREPWAQARRTAQHEGWVFGHISGCPDWLFCDHRSPFE